MCRPVRKTRPSMHWCFSLARCWTWTWVRILMLNVTGGQDQNPDLRDGEDRWPRSIDGGQGSRLRAGERRRASTARNGKYGARRARNSLCGSHVRLRIALANSFFELASTTKIRGIRAWINWTHSAVATMDLVAIVDGHELADATAYLALPFVIRYPSWPSSAHP